MTLKRLFSQPSPDETGPLASTDAYRLWLARIVAAAASLGILLLSLLAVIAAPSDAPQTLLLLLLDLLPLASSLLALAYLLRRDAHAPYNDRPVFIWLLSLWLYLLLDVFTTSGMRAPYGSSLLLLLLIAGLLLNGRRFRAFAAITVITLVLGMALDQAGALPTGGLHPELLARLDLGAAAPAGAAGSLSPLSVWIGSILNMLIASGLLYLYNRSIHFSLTRSRRELLERRAAEQALRQSQERYRNFIEHSFEGVWLIQFDQPILTDLPPAEQAQLIYTTGYISEANQAQARMTGFTNRADLIGMRLTDLFVSSSRFDPGDGDGVDALASAVPGAQIPPEFAATLVDLVTSGYRQFEHEMPEFSVLDERRIFLVSTVGVLTSPAPGTPVLLTGLWSSRRDVTASRLAQAALQRRNDQLTTLHRIAATLATFKDLNGVLMEVLSSLKSSLPLDVFYVALYDEPSDRMRYPLVYDSEKFFATIGDNKAPDWLLTLLETRRPLRVNRTPEQIESRRCAGPLFIGDRSRVSASLLAAPLQVGARLIGVISVQSYALSAYDEQHLEFLTLASQNVAVAIDNAALYENLQRELHERIKAENALQQLNVELERRVERRTAELETAVRELEAFSYSVSHDLRGPLRAIDGYSRFLIEDYSDRLDGEGRLFLDNVRKAAQRMGLLIDDLLNLSRVSRLDVRLQKVDLSALVKDIAAVLRLRDPNRAVEISVQPELAACADPNLLRLALENLMDNAWKFTARTSQARIEFTRIDLGAERPPPEQAPLHLEREEEQGEGEISSVSGPAGLTFCLRDNGAGFDMRYIDKLFKPFSRLHGVEEFEGTGIGLAGVKRIIERHGGEIWAEGSIGGGAAFYFTLPCELEDAGQAQAASTAEPDLG